MKVLLALAQIAGQRLIRLSDEAQMQRLELTRLKALEGPEPLPLHDRNHTTPEAGPEPESRSADRGNTGRGDGAPKDPLD